MGRGSGSSESKVKKQRTLKSEVGAGVSGPGGGGNQNDSCLFSFDDKISVTTSTGQNMKVSDSVTFVPNFSTSKIDIFIKNKVVGLYNGAFLSKLLKCMKKRYVYEGEVKKIDRLANSLAINFSVQGRK